MNCYFSDREGDKVLNWGEDFVVFQINVFYLNNLHFYG